MSKLIVYDFKCPCCNTVFERMVHSDKHTYVCPECQSPDAKRQISAPRFDIRMGVDPTGNPTMGDKWARMHTQARKVEDKRARDHGPSAWGSDGADVRR
jgi:putative FmdB family regulatory protein